MSTTVAGLAATAASGAGIGAALQQAAAGLPVPSVAPQPTSVLKMVYMSTLTGAVQRAGSATKFSFFGALKELNLSLDEIKGSQPQANALQNAWAKYPTTMQRVHASVQTMYEAAASTRPAPFGSTAVTELAYWAWCQGLIQATLLKVTAGMPASSFVTSPSYASPVLKMLFMSVLNGAISSAGYPFSTFALLTKIKYLRAALLEVRSSLPQASALQLALEQGLPSQITLSVPTAPSFGVTLPPTLFTQLKASQVPVQSGNWAAASGGSFGASFAAAQSEMLLKLTQYAQQNTQQMTLANLQEKLLQQLHFNSGTSAAMHQIAMNVIRNISV